MNIPSDLKYTDSHEWLKVEGDTGIMGITDFAQGELGDIVFVDLPKVGSKVEKGKPLGTVEAVKAVSDLNAPVSGEVVEINTDLEGTPDAVNKDCYGAGWMVKIRITNPAELDSLMDAMSYDRMEKHGH